MPDCLCISVPLLTLPAHDYVRVHQINRDYVGPLHCQAADATLYLGPGVQFNDWLHAVFIPVL